MIFAKIGPAFQPAAASLESVVMGFIAVVGAGLLFAAALLLLDRLPTGRRSRSD